MLQQTEGNTESVAGLDIARDFGVFERSLRETKSRMRLTTDSVAAAIAAAYGSEGRS